jgi:myo-inositol 2-dehydrogenase/D-chiro-inositol 1-dehydrogenase
MIAFALVGAGRIGRLHAGNIAAHPGARLLCVADVDAAAAGELAACHGATAVPVEAALAGDADAVLIASSTDTHARLIEAAASHGKAVFCEKPIDLDTARARAAVEVTTRAGVPLAVGFNRRFDPSFAALKARLQAGEIGRLEMLSIVSRDPAPPPLEYVRVSGGLFRDMMIHDLDMACWLLGEMPETVHAMGSVLVDPGIGECGDVDSALVTLRTASGRLAQISNSRRAVYGYDQRVECLGAEGMLRAGNVREDTVEFAGRCGYRRAALMHFFLQRYAEAYRAELDAFVVALERGDSPAPDGSDGVRALVLADAAQASLVSRGPIRVA